MAHRLRDIIELSVNSKDEATRRKQRTTALKDIKFDALRGYIQWPQHEHNASRHYVHAASLAKEHHTVSIHALYSKAEMDTARKDADREAAEQLAAKIESKGRLAVEREKHSLPTSMFHEVVKSSWDYDPTLQLNNDAVARKSVFAATLIADHIAGEIPELLGYRQATAANHPEREMWIESKGRERTTLEKMGTWVMVPRSSVPKGHRPIKCKFDYRKKLLKGESLSFKSRLVRCGYSQRAGIVIRRSCRLQFVSFPCVIGMPEELHSGTVRHPSGLFPGRYHRHYLEGDPARPMGRREAAARQRRERILMFTEEIALRTSPGRIRMGRKFQGFSSSGPGL
jgi:hypothetical protein